MRQREHFGHMHSKLIKYEYAGSRLGIGRPIFGQAVLKSARLIVSQLGMATGETLEIFTHAAYAIDPGTPIAYDGDFYLIASAVESGSRIYTTAKAGRVRKVTAEVSEYETELDALRRPVKKETVKKLYDGFLLERYEGNARETEAHGITAQRMVLLLPRSAVFLCGRVLTCDEEAYVITKRYMGGRHWNEYEILREADR